MQTLYLVRGWGLGTRLVYIQQPQSVHLLFLKNSITVSIGSGEGTDPQQAETRKHRR